MTDKPEFTRNDRVAITFFGKIVDRLEEDKSTYEARCEQRLAEFKSLMLPYPFGNVSYPAWEPTLTRAEYATLKAWADGEDILVHILSEER